MRVVYKDLPLARHELAHGAHEAARCAGAAGRYWGYHDRLFAAQPAFDRPDLIRYAADLGIDTAAFTRCLDSRQFAAQVDEDIAQARQLGIRGTPTFLINGRRLVGAHPVASFRDVINDALGRKRDAEKE